MTCNQRRRDGDTSLWALQNTLILHGFYIFFIIYGSYKTDLNPSTIKSYYVPISMST